MPNKRNEPCFCGSGKKYKNCHMIEEYEKKHPRFSKRKGYLFACHAVAGLLVFTYFSSATLNSTFSAELLIFISVSMSFFFCHLVFKRKFYSKYVTDKFKLDSGCSFFLKFGLIALLASPILTLNHVFSFGDLKTEQAVIIDKEKNGRYNLYELVLQLKSERVSYTVTQDVWLTQQVNNQVELKIQRGIMGFNVIKGSGIR